MSPKIARKVIREFQASEAEDRFLITPRERDVLKCIEGGLAYKEIARKLFISPHTVHTHIKKIYEKLQARNRQDVLLRARRKGIP